MNTTEIRNMNWEEIQRRLEGWRAMVYEALSAHGPCTTGELAAKTGMSILTVRPRVTELMQLGFAELKGQRGKEGIYAAIPQWRALESWKVERERKEEGKQLEMRF